jgi:hypothetical protein
MSDLVNYPDLKDGACLHRVNQSVQRQFNYQSIRKTWKQETLFPEVFAHLSLIQEPVDRGSYPQSIRRGSLGSRISLHRHAFAPWTEVEVFGRGCVPRLSCSHIQLDVCLDSEASHSNPLTILLGSVQNLKNSTLVSSPS